MAAAEVDLGRVISRRTLLVYCESSRQASELIGAAFDFAGGGSRVVALAVTFVPPSLPLHGLPSHMDDRSQAILLRAGDIARRRGSGIETRLQRGRDAASVIVREARRLEASAIFLALEEPRFGWLRPMLPRPARQVIRLAPCPVFLVHFPFGSGRETSGVMTEVERLVGRPS